MDVAVTIPPGGVAWNVRSEPPSLQMRKDFVALVPGIAAASIEGGRSARIGGITPAPVSATCREGFRAFEVKVSVAFREPTAEGVNVTAMVVLSPGSSSNATGLTAQS